VGGKRERERDREKKKKKSKNLKICFYLGSRILCIFKTTAKISLF